jgi:hypothetical protein
MHDLIAQLHFSRLTDQKTYMVCLIQSPDELITIFRRFSAPDYNRTGQAGLNQPGRFA